MKMKNIYCFSLFLVSYCLLMSILCHGNEITSNDMQWNMAKHFGKKYNVNYWILYHDARGKDSSWKRLWFDAMKNEQRLGYFSTNVLPFSNSSNTNKGIGKIKGTNLDTLHLFIHPNLESLRKLMALDVSSGSQTNIWLINMPKDRKQKALFSNHTNRFLTNPDMKIFGYFVSGNGDIKVHRMYKQNLNAKIILQPFGVWNKQNKFYESSNKSSSNHLSLEGSHLQVLSALSPPSVTYIEDVCTSKDCFKCQAYFSANTNTTASTTSEIMNSLPVNSHQNGHLNGGQNSVQVITSDNGK